ncbi:hypothetical protein OG883_38630 [Streptomyces sp. NBC_01142]|uniref:hypothetical protein n=1 Tax=Streptomyces sp. NBC_01142 TaxID=2975865 RepID=UPI002252A08A|nr:hypothetical protein [Streptomyces sp. NBC_01142]MCX4825665.1 hypothetical protein [Streptomyces sp. NBC_01142]
MSEIRTAEVPLLVLRMVPESAEFISEKYGMPADQAVLTAALMQRCFDLVERLMESPDESLRGAVYLRFSSSS